MLKDNFFENLAKKVVESMPDGVKEFKDDLEKNIKTVLQQALGKLDLVTREEFDVQVALLAKLQKRVEALEKKLKEEF